MYLKVINCCYIIALVAVGKDVPDRHLGITWRCVCQPTEMYGHALA